MKNKRVGIIGVGNVGSTLAFVLASKNICKEIILKDVRANIVQAMSLDISQAAHAASSQVKIIAALEEKDFKDCDIIVITAGIARKPGMSRDDLLLTNAKIMTSVVKESIKNNPNAILLIVSNPLDAMVYTALKASSYDRSKVIGMAGILDSARMSHFIAQKLSFKADIIEASVMGGHGDDMVPLPNLSKVDGKALSEVLSQEDISDVLRQTKQGGAQIVSFLGNGSAYYAPAYSTSLMIEAILNDSKAVFPCAVALEGEYNYSNIVAGVPVSLGSCGVEKVIEYNLDPSQKEKFAKSIASVEDLVNTLNDKFF